jgi:hypothetical protein
VKGKGVQMTSLCPPGQVEQKKRDERASMGSDRAATTWRRAGGSGHRGVCGEGQQRKGTAPGLGGNDTWEEGKHEVDDGGLHGGGRGSCAGGKT